MKFSGSWASVVDSMYPRLAGSARSRKVHAKKHWRRLASLDRRLVEKLGSNEDQLKQYTAEVDKLLEREQSRKQSVEARLTSIMGLMSIAATIVLSGLVALATGALSAPSWLATLIFACGSLYLVLQLFVALMAAIDGLSRTAHLEETAVDLFALPNAAPGVRLRSEIARKLERLHDYRQGGDAKVGHMAVAHCAVRNFLVALLLLALAAALFAVTRDTTSQPKPGDRASAAALHGHMHDRTPTPTATRVAIMRIATIGPFPEGGHVLRTDAVLQCLRKRFTADLGSTIGGWQIVGRVDKRRLKPPRAQLYGSNQALAMTRANWVRDQILSQMPGFEPEASIVSVGGAGQVGFNVGAQDLQSDRTVHIYALVTQAVGKDGKVIDRSSRPLTCPG